MQVLESIGWPEWIAAHSYRKTGAGRGIRYRKVVNALEAVYADAGLIICGFALIQRLLEQGKLSTPFPKAQGFWSEDPYRNHVLRKSA